VCESESVFDLIDHLVSEVQVAVDHSVVVQLKEVGLDVAEYEAYAVVHELGALAQTQAVLQQLELFLESALQPFNPNVEEPYRLNAGHTLYGVLRHHQLDVDLVQCLHVVQQLHATVFKIGQAVAGRIEEFVYQFVETLVSNRISFSISFSIGIYTKTRISTWIIVHGIISIFIFIFVAIVNGIL